MQQAGTQLEQVVCIGQWSSISATGQAGRHTGAHPWASSLCAPVSAPSPRLSLSPHPLISLSLSPPASLCISLSLCFFVCLSHSPGPTNAQTCQKTLCDNCCPDDRILGSPQKSTQRRISAGEEPWSSRGTVQRIKEAWWKLNVYDIDSPNRTEFEVY
jgi:hypothetical protein